MRPTDRWRAEFEEVLPRIERHARFFFRDIRCPSRQDDLVAEAVALSWKWWLRLKSQGKQPELFSSTLASFAARAARNGRRVTGQERARDVLSPRAQREHAFAVGTLIEHETLTPNPLTDALIDNTQTPVDEQVCFRLDFPAWVQTFDDRRRKMLFEMMRGELTCILADRYEVTAARISQHRRAFYEDWTAFLA